MSRKIQVTCLFALFVLTLSITAQAETPVVEWIRQVGSSSNRYDVGSSVVFDNNGSIYVTGSTDGNFDGHINTSSTGHPDIFLAKYDTNGNKLWTDQVGTSLQEDGHGVAVDGKGNVYVTGSTRGDLAGNGNPNHDDMVLIKYDSDGNKQWIEQMDLGEYEHGNDVAVDNDGNIYVTGFINECTSYMAYVTKYDSDGNQLWVKKQDTIGYGKSVSVDSNGNVYMTGFTRDNSDRRDTFLIKYDTNGNKLWTEELGTTGFDYAYGVSVDSNGNAYITGSSRGDFDGNTNAGGSDMFLVRYDTDGNKQWTQLLGTAGNDEGWDVSVDDSGNVYVTGSTQGDFDDPTSCINGYNAFLTKFDMDGNQFWTEYFHTPYPYASLGNFGFGVSVDSDGSAYITGRNAANDMFVAKITTVSEPTTITLILASLLALAAFRIRK